MKFIAGLIAGVLLVIAVAALYFMTGMAPVATAAAPMPFEKYFAGKALHAAVDREMPRSVPIQADETNLLAGAQIYRDDCAVCHGLPNSTPTHIAAGEFPKPPQLFHGKGVTDDPPGETYWKVANGIRLSGMPGFKSTMTDIQAWQVSLLLANADKLPASVQTAISIAPATGGTAPQH
jgi:thiosulfate dehydrogenase